VWNWKNRKIFCVQVFFWILLCVCLRFHHRHTFLNATLARAREKHCWFSCFYSRINMEGVEDALEFHVEEGFFLLNKKMSDFFFNWLWLLHFVYIFAFQLLIFCFTFLSSSNVFIYRYAKMRVCIQMGLHVSPFLLTTSTTLFYLLLLP